MKSLKTSIKEVAYHVFEVVVCLSVAAFALRFFGDFNGVDALVAGLVLNGLMKFARSYEKIPMPDYSNLE